MLIICKMKTFHSNTHYFLSQHSQKYNIKQKRLEIIEYKFHIILFDFSTFFLYHQIYMITSVKRVQHRKKFTREEDDKLIKLVKKFGTKSWEEVAKYMPRRCGRQCRDRYNNYLLENFTKGPWTAEEDNLINSKYDEIGAHWVEISKLLPGRSGNDVKNRWHKTLSKRRLFLNCNSRQSSNMSSMISDNISCTAASSSEESSDTEPSEASSEFHNDDRISLMNECQLEYHPTCQCGSEQCFNRSRSKTDNDSLFSLFEVNHVWNLFPLNAEETSLYEYVLF
ncbi:Myb-like DNA-binding domain containing protein [Tritrichomonas foetus]|uniref:Myb-like DNA-binding domain containing protein n=1 Tax=Tritrichomonas foetus TaxID=1144522 RepID=A0A1J4L367_9EUKA|nr:Myb-like DNA-binding domain containing protein [Tritrichomonas foetus]|eukprot:OHT17520.1 Myb-like DNA-binding domain containing protein [Tritrichomonas foetus]